MAVVMPAATMPDATPMISGIGIVQARNFFDWLLGGSVSQDRPSQYF
jgi:hypothetical protein